jgi:hypothetical protein
VKQFLGFADDQLKRMTGQKGRGKKGQRPEIEVEFEYDVKAAMHTLRLLYECKELVSSGTITLPRPEREIFWFTFALAASQWRKSSQWQRN